MSHRTAVGLPVLKPKLVVKVCCAFCGRHVAREVTYVIRQEHYCRAHFTTNDARIFRERNR